MRWYNFKLRLQLEPLYISPTARVMYRNNGCVETIAAGTVGSYVYPNEADFGAKQVQFVSQHPVKFAARTQDSYWTGRVKKEKRQWFFEYAELEDEKTLLWEKYTEMKLRMGVVDTRMSSDRPLPFVRHPGFGNAVDITILLASRG